MQRLILFSLLVLIEGGAASAKPLLSNSQFSYARACLDQSEPPLRLVQICEAALHDGGMSDLQRSRALHNLGWAQYDLGSEEAARGIFVDLHNQFPESSYGNSALGWLAYYEDAFAEAIPRFEKALKARMTARDMSGLALSRYYENQISLDQALEQVDAALAIRPDYPWLLREKGWVLGKAGRYDEAISAFETAIDYDPESAYSHYGLTWVYSEIDLWEETLTAANSTLELDPDFQAALSRRSLALLNLNRPKQALKDAERIIALAPEDTDGYVRKARAYNALGWNRKAREVLAKSDDSLGYSAYLVYWRAHLLYDAQKYDLARVQIDRVFSTGDQDYFDKKLLAVIALEQGDLAVAREAADAAVAERPGDAWGLYTQAQVAVAEARYEDAVELFGQAISNGLSHTETGVFAGILSRQGQFLTAIALRLKYGSGTE